MVLVFIDYQPKMNRSRGIFHYQAECMKTNPNSIWALARAPDLHFNTYQLLTSTKNSTQHTIKVPRRIHLPDGLSARALKHRYMACYGTRLSLSPDSTTTEKRQNETFLNGYNSTTIQDTA